MKRLLIALGMFASFSVMAESNYNCIASTVTPIGTHSPIKVSDSARVLPVILRGTSFQTPTELFDSKGPIETIGVGTGWDSNLISYIDSKFETALTAIIPVEGNVNRSLDKVDIFVLASGIGDIELRCMRQSPPTGPQWANIYIAYSIADTLSPATQQFAISQKNSLQNYLNCAAKKVCYFSSLTSEEYNNLIKVNPPTKEYYEQNAPVYGGGWYCSESGSCYGDISKLTGRAKTTYVQGYYRSSGTYVRSYFRSR